MKATYTLPDFPFMFNRIIHFTGVDGGNEPIVRFEWYDEDLGKTPRGIALVLGDGNEVVYCDEFNNTHFARTWLYTRDKHVYHFIRQMIAKDFDKCNSLEVYILDERAQSPASRLDNPWVSATSIEQRLITEPLPLGINRNDDGPVSKLKKKPKR